MNQNNIQIWLPPMLTMLGVLITVVFTAWLNSRFFEAKIDAAMETLRADIAEFRTEVKLELQSLSHRVERLEERAGIVVKR